MHGVCLHLKDERGYQKKKFNTDLQRQSKFKH